MALVKLVEYHGGDARERGIGEQAAGEHTFGEETQPGMRAGDLFEADLVADGGADGFAAFGGYEARGQARGQAAGL
jgi:hypothetical protein